MAFDMVAAEYGWTDEQMADLPIIRLRQIVAAIRTRRYQRAREENSRFAWLARQITSYVAAGWEIAEGQENKGLTQAATLGYDDIEVELLKEAQKRADDVPVHAEPPVGSFERILGFMSQTRG